MSKSTPGPWFVEQKQIWHEGGLACIATVHSGITGGEDLSEAQAANAHLIAAAPQMREKLRAIELAVDGLNTKGYQQKSETQGALDRIKAHCRAALKAADGEGE